MVRVRVRVRYRVNANLDLDIPRGGGTSGGSGGEFSACFAVFLGVV